MRIAALLLASVALATGCLGGGDTPAGDGTPIEGYGLRVLVPDGWDGRVAWDGPGYAITLGASTTASATLGEDDASIVIDDLGPPPSGIERDQDWVVDPELPLALADSDVLGPFTCGFPAGANLSVVLAGRALLIRVRFGSWPGGDDLDEVNELLASLRVAPRPLR